MNKNAVAANVKDLVGRVERQARDWAGDTGQPVGGAKQAEGRLQQAWGKVQDEAKKSVDELKKKNAEREEEKRSAREVVPNLKPPQNKVANE
jgi:uncharacterized protein YjbJ (UPF0337 family)